MNFETVFKALGEPTRIRIMRLLAHRPMYVCELEFILGMSQPRISQHLKILKHADIVDDEREGQRSVYSLNKEFIDQVFSGFIQFIEKPLDALGDYSEEFKRISSLADNPHVNSCKNSCKS